MTVGNLRQLGVRGLLLVCLDPKCRYEATFGVDDYSDDIELTSFAPRMVCSTSELEGNADSAAEPA